MTSIEDIIHKDDWKRAGRVAPTETWYTESEIKVMLYNYGMEVHRELWEEIMCYIEDSEWHRAKSVFDDIEKEIQNQVIV